MRHSGHMLPATGVLVLLLLNDPAFFGECMPLTSTCKKRTCTFLFGFLHVSQFLNSFSLYFLVFKFSSAFPFLPSITPSPQSLPSLSPFRPFHILRYVQLHAPCLNVEGYQSTPFDGINNRTYDTLYGFHRLSAVAGWIKSWKHLCCRGTVVRFDKATYVNMQFTDCTKKEVYEDRLTQAD